MDYEEERWQHTPTEIQQPQCRHMSRWQQTFKYTMAWEAVIGARQHCVPTKKSIWKSLALSQLGSSSQDFSNIFLRVKTWSVVLLYENHTWHHLGLVELFHGTRFRTFGIRFLKEDKPRVSLVVCAFFPVFFLVYGQDHQFAEVSIPFKHIVTFETR